MTAAASFREWREQAGLSLAALARQTGVPVGVLSDLERGKGRADDRVLVSLADVYGRPIPDLAERCPVPSGLRDLLSRPGVNFPEGLVVRLCRVEFRGGQTLSADDWAHLAEQLTTDEHPSTRQPEDTAWTKDRRTHGKGTPDGPEGPADRR